MAKILIVDDNRDNLALLEYILRAEGHAAVPASNGREALARARAERPDAVITDILMPVMDGFELCRRWRADRSLASLPFIFYSATYTEPEDMRFALDLGADRFIVKPQEPEALVRAVREVLEMQRGRRPAVRREKKPTDVTRAYSEVLFRKLERKVAQLEAEIESRRRAEAEIALKNAVLTAQLESTADGVLGVDEHGGLLFANARFLDLWGIPPRAIESGSFSSALEAIKEKLADPERTVEGERRLFGNREEKRRDEILLADGRIVDRYSAPIAGEGGRYFGRIWYVRDVTVARTAERENALQAELLDSAIDSIFLLDADGRILYANRNAAALRGYSREEILRLNLRDLNDPENAREVPGRLEMILREGFALYESVHVKKNGARFNVEILARVVEIDGKKRILTSNRDVTGRRRSLEALAESEHRYRTLFEVSPDVMYSVDRDGAVVSLNPAFEKITGWPREEWIDRPFTGLFHPDDLEKSGEWFRRVLGGEMLKAAELRVRSKSGEYIVGEFSAAPFFRQGRAAGLHGAARDVTERKRAEEALRDSEEKFRSIFDNAGEGIFLVDPGTMGFVMCNPACAAMTGYSREEFASLSLRDMHPKEAIGEVEQGIAAFRRGEKRIHRSLKFRRKDGSDFDADLSIARATFAGKDFLIMIFTDITERRQAELEIRMYKERLEELVAERTGELRRANESLGGERNLLRALIDSLPDEVYVKDGRGRFTLANATLLRSLGFGDFGELAGRTDFDLYGGEEAERFHREERKIIKSGEALLGREEETADARGGKRWLLVSKVPFRDARGNIIGLVGINRDISGLKLAEESLQKAKEQAEAASNAKTAFLAAVSHEIRTPMNAILGFTRLLLRDPGLTPRQKERLDVINRSGEHLVALLNNVLELSKIETGHAGVVEAAFDLAALAAGIETMFRLKAGEKQIVFDVSIEDSGPGGPGAFVVSDEVKIRQILINLVGNAIKFTDEGRVALRLRLKRSGAAGAAGSGPGPELVVEVEDTGRGIPEREADRIFGEFEQGEAGLSAGGAGLGLSLSRRLARLLGGDITLERNAVRGSLFRVRIPVREGAKADEERSVPAGRAAVLKSGQGTRTVLVVDDNPESRFYLLEILSAAGFETAEAGNGREAVERFRELGPDLVLMDINMEVMDGYEAAARIRAAGGTKVPVIAVTSNAFLESRGRIREAGFDGVVVKPFREREIFDVLERHLGVSFEYGEAVPADAGASLDEVRRGIARLPRELTDELLDAARNLELGRLLAAVDRAETIAPEAAGCLREAAKRYRYARVAELLGGKGAGDE